MTTSKSKAVRTIYVQSTFREVIFSHTVKAESLEEALTIARGMNVSEVLDNSPEWIDGQTEVTGVYES